MVPAITLFVGLAVGGGIVEGYHRLHDKRTAEVFSRRLRCNEIANQYAKKESSDTRSVSVELAGYSEASNSCVAYLKIWEQIGPSYSNLEWRVLDVLSHEERYYGHCTFERDCGSGKDIKFDEESEAAFQRAISDKEVKKK